MQNFAGLKSPETLMALVDPGSSNLSGSTFALRSSVRSVGGLFNYSNFLYLLTPKLFGCAGASSGFGGQSQFHSEPTQLLGGIRPPKIH